MDGNSLTGISNNQLKKVRKLLRKKGRYKFGQFLIEGRRAVKQIFKNDLLKVDLLCFDEKYELWKQEPWDRYSRNYETVLIDSRDFRQVTDTENPQGVMSVIEMPEETEVEELSQNQGIVLALDALQDPGNLGTIIRSATWFDAAGMLVGKGTVDPFHPKVVRGTAGATGSLPYQMGNLEEMLPFFQNAGWRVVTLDVSSDATELSRLEDRDSTMLVVGNEGHGVSAAIKEFTDQTVQIPGSSRGRHRLESLNAAVSVGISLYELYG